MTHRSLHEFLALVTLTLSVIEYVFFDSVFIMYRTLF